MSWPDVLLREPARPRRVATAPWAPALVVATVCIGAFLGQLDANVVHLPPLQRVDTHTEPELDVLLLVVDGGGTLGTTEGSEPLGEGRLIWLPHGSTRSVTAGTEGLSYLTVHRRRPGMRIGHHPPGRHPTAAHD